MKKFLTYAVVALMSLSMIVSDCDAKGGFGGGRSGGFSSSRSSSFSRSTSSPSRSSWGSKTTSSKSSARTSVTSKTDTKATRTYTKNGKTMTRTQAVSDFKSKAKSDPKVQASLAKNYPTKFTSKPATRPSYIPQSYNGNTVIYQNGGYGYMSGGSFNPLMTYMLLDTMSDAAMMSAMTSSGYRASAGTTVVATDSGGSFIGWFFLLFACGAVILIFVALLD